jgi:DNA-binding MarR family transcriptional regulator
MAGQLQTPWHEEIHLPALLRHARNTYGAAMREALEAAGCGDIPRNGLYVIGGLAMGRKEVPLAVLIRDLRISKQSAGQLVDALVTRGYLNRRVDPDDRRRLVITLTRRGHAAAETQAAAREAIDAELEERIGERGMGVLRKGLAALVAIGQRRESVGTSP